MQALRLLGKQNLLFIILLYIWTARKPLMTLNNVLTMKINLILWVFSSFKKFTQFAFLLRSKVQQALLADVPFTHNK